jgi:tRNA1(Val) A37 N6-methylase TrmN6
MSKEGKYGQFFTEKEMCDYVLELVNNIKKIGGNCLEPSFGDGEFIKSLEKYNFEKLDGVEIDNKHYNKYNSNNKKIEVFNKDFLDFNSDITYDFIVGNPPYIELCYSFYSKNEQDKIKKLYKNISNGRINLVHIFLKKCFNMLNYDGIIAFLLPSSVLTSPIYKKIRKEIFDNYTIEFLKEDVNFKGVAIKVSLLVIRKNKTNNNFFFINNDNFFIMENYNNFKETKTIKDYGFDVSIGEIVWNQKKDILTDDSNENILIYSNNIKYDKLDISSNRDRKQYIKLDTIKHENCIIFPRTISKKIKFHYVKNNKNMIFENHVLVLTNNNSELLDKFYFNLKSGSYDKLLNSFFNSSNLTKSELLSLPLEV